MTLASSVDASSCRCDVRAGSNSELTKSTYATADGVFTRDGQIDAEESVFTQSHS